MENLLRELNGWDVKEASKAGELGAPNVNHQKNQWKHAKILIKCY